MMLKIVKMLGSKRKEIPDISGSCVLRLFKVKCHTHQTKNDEAPVGCLRLLSSIIYIISCLEVFFSSSNTMLRKLDFQNQLPIRSCLAPVSQSQKSCAPDQNIEEPCGCLRLLHDTYTLSCVAVFSSSPYKILKIPNSQKNRRVNHVRLLYLQMK